MIYTDLNPSGEMGANCCLIEIGPFKLVIDCGIDPKELGTKAIPNLDLLDGQFIDLAILTHCHLDHLGAFPLLPTKKPDLEIVKSVPSEILYQRLLHNSVNVMKRQRENHYLSEYPLYCHDDVDRLAKNVYSLPFGKKKILEKGGEELSITLHSLEMSCFPLNQLFQVLIFQTKIWIH